MNMVFTYLISLGYFVLKYKLEYFFNYFLHYFFFNYFGLLSTPSI